MKTALAALLVLAATVPFGSPAAAFDRFADRPDVVAVQDHGWGRGDGWRSRDDWRDRRDWRGYRNERGDMLSEQQVARRLMRQGFVRIDDIDRRRDRYVVQAVRPNGALVRLAVDAYDGDIVASERIGWVADRRVDERRYRQPTSGVEFDLGTGTLGIYSR